MEPLDWVLAAPVLAVLAAVAGRQARDAWEDLPELDEAAGRAAVLGAGLIAATAAAGASAGLVVAGPLALLALGAAVLGFRRQRPVPPDLTDAAPVAQVLGKGDDDPDDLAGPPALPGGGSWRDHAPLLAALERVAAQRRARVEGDDTRRIVDPQGLVLLEARPAPRGQVGVILRATPGAPRRERLILTANAWRVHRRGDEPLPAQIRALGEGAPAALDALLEEPGAQRVVLGPHGLRLELELEPERRAALLLLRESGVFGPGASPPELLGLHLGRLLSALEGLGRPAPTAGAAVAAAGEGVRVVLYDPAPPAAPAQRCPYCRSDLSSEPELARCGRCGTTHHAACWDEGGGCTVLGCGARRAARSRVGG